MDGTGIAVILLFVFTMFSSIGGNGIVSSNISSLPGSSTQVNMPSDIPVSYAASYTPQVQDSVARFVNVRAKTLAKEDIDQVVASLMKYGQQYDINPKLVAAMIDRESSFNPNSVSSSNAQGFAQLLPTTAAHIGIRDPFDLDEGVKGASLYLKMMVDKWSGNPNQVALGLASYAEGPNQIVRAGGTYTDATKRYIQDIFSKYAMIN